MLKAIGAIGSLIGYALGTGIPVAAASSGEGASFLIEISSVGDADYAGECVVVDATGESRLEIVGSSSFRQEVRGDKLTCTITQSRGVGGLVVEIRGPAGNVTRSRTSGPGSSVRVTTG